MNFKTIIRAAKLPYFKREVIIDGTRIACADGYIAVWCPTDSEDGSFDVDGNPTEDGGVSAETATREYICLAYEQDGVVSRAAVACMNNETGGE